MVPVPVSGKRGPEPHDLSVEDKDNSKNKSGLNMSKTDH